MGYISLGPNAHGKADLVIRGELVVFVVLTAIFLLLTLGTWAIFERRAQQKAGSEKTEKSV
jgi:hypothetical protein